MTLEQYKSVIPKDVIKNYIREIEKTRKTKRWIRLNNAFKSLDDASFRIGIPLDPRFNTLYWAEDVRSLCHEIGYGYCWMKAYADHYKEVVPKGEKPAHTHFHVSYFADNCITRIDSCRNKTALIVWAYYCAFDPGKPILDYGKILEILKAPIKFGLFLQGVDSFLQHLDKLRNNEFQIIRQYRNLKIHRREPRIELHGVEDFHGWPYVFPLTKPPEIKRWTKELEKTETNPALRTRIENSSRYQGVLFEHRRTYDHMWDYEEILRLIRNSFFRLLVASEGCIRVLRRRKPFRT